jgi:hypothetical protein
MTATTGKHPTSKVVFGLGGVGFGLVLAHFATGGNPLERMVTPLFVLAVLTGIAKTGTA